MIRSRRVLLFAAFLVISAEVLNAESSTLRVVGAQATFEAEGVVVSAPDSDAWALHIELAALARGNAREVLPCAPGRRAGPRVERRLSIQSGGLLEWYTTEGGGLRQGFTLEAPPFADRLNQPLRLELARNDGFDVEIHTSGRSAVFRHRSTGTRISYGQLQAWDSTGELVPIRLVRRAGELSLQIDDREASYPLLIDPLILVLEATISQSTPQFLDYFAWSVAIHGDTIVAGSPGDGTMAYQAGGLYVYTRTGSTWSESHRIYAPAPSSFTSFGFTVALDGNTLLTADGTSFYSYARSGSNWVLQQTFGSQTAPGSMLLDGDDLITGRGSTGLLNHFTRLGSNWSLAGTISTSDGAPLRAALSLEGDLLAAGSSESAYIFQRSGTTWVQSARIEAPDPSPGDRFGDSVALQGDSIVVGAPADDDLGDESGSVYVFERSGTRWVPTAKLLDPAGAPNRFFGYRLLMREGTLSIADRFARIRTYSRSNGEWTERAVFDPTDAYLYSLATDGTRIAVGAGGSDQIFVLRDDSVLSYCSGKSNSVGCVPFTDTHGLPSSTSPDPFVVRARDVVPGQAGFLLYGFKKANLAFHGGQLCVKLPFNRTSVKSAKADPGSCSGSKLVQDFNKRIQGTTDPQLSVGQTVYAQWFQRDPADPAGFGDGLTNAVRFTICP